MADDPIAAAHAELISFIQERQHTITNALEVHARRMREAAAGTTGNPAYAVAFNDDAERAERTANQLVMLLANVDLQTQLHP